MRHTYSQLSEGGQVQFVELATGQQHDERHHANSCKHKGNAPEAQAPVAYRAKQGAKAVVRIIIIIIVFVVLIIKICIICSPPPFLPLSIFLP